MAIIFAPNTSPMLRSRTKRDLFYRAGSTCPRHSPKPMRWKPSRSHQARRMMASPSSRKVRVSPLDSVSGVFAAGAELQQRAGLLGPRARQRARPQQVARLQVAAVDGCGASAAARPSSRRRGSCCADRRSGPVRQSRGGLQPHLECPRPGAPCVRGCPANPGRAAAAGRPRARENAARNGANASRVTIHGEIVLRKILGQEGAQRLVLPGLHVARRPVVEQHHPESVGLGLRHAHQRRPAHCPAPPARRVRVRSPAAGWAARPVPPSFGPLVWPSGRGKLLAADAYRRCTAVVADGHPFVVRQQRRVGTEQLADRGRMVDAGVEVGVVADTARQVQRRPRPAGCRKPDHSRCCALPSARPCERSPCPKRRCISCGLCAISAVHVAGSRSARPPAGPAPGRRWRHRCGARPCGVRLYVPKGRFWIGKSVLGLVGGGYPAAQLGVVGGVQLYVHGRLE